MKFSIASIYCLAAKNKWTKKLTYVDLKLRYIANFQTKELRRMMIYVTNASMRSLCVAILLFLCLLLRLDLLLDLFYSSFYLNA
jgi:hypothetical protein